MMIASRSAFLAAGFALFSTAAFAQAPASTSTTAVPDTATRPATTTFFGDTGIWYVPTGEVLGDGKWSASGYRRGTNWIQGYTNVADFAGTFAFGIKNRAEIFGSLLVDTRIDRDLRPLFVNDSTVGGIIDRYPLANKYWSGDNLGDLYLGAKINLWSESRQNPAAIAVRAMAKLPTGKKDAGVSTGKPDFSFDLIASKEAKKLVEVSGFGGYEFRGSPDGIDAPTGAFRWGTGVAFPSRNMLRLSGELNGMIPSKDTATITGSSIVGTDLTRAPLTSNVENITRATLGLTFQARNGFFAGAGVSWNAPSRSRNGSFTDEPDVLGDYYDMQFRVGYHPGVKVYTPPPPPPAPAAPAPPPAHTLTVKAACDPCTVETGGNSTVTATVQDSISCSVTYRWSAPSGTLAQPAERATRWTAGQQAGTVPVTVTVTCPSDNKTASDTVNIQVTAPPPKRTYQFEDVFFDFDRYSLRPEATRVLDEA